MEKLLKDGYAVELPDDDFEGIPDKTWYQAHFSVESSKNFGPYSTVQPGLRTLIKTIFCFVV